MLNNPYRDEEEDDYVEPLKPWQLLIVWVVLFAAALTILYLIYIAFIKPNV